MILAIPLSILAVVIYMKFGFVSKLTNGEVIGKIKNEIFKSEDKSAALEKVINVSINEKNYETFFFSDTNVCVGHFQKAEGFEEYINGLN